MFKKEDVKKARKTMVDEKKEKKPQLPPKNDEENPRPKSAFDKLIATLKAENDDLKQQLAKGHHETAAKDELDTAVKTRSIQLLEKAVKYADEFNIDTAAASKLLGDLKQAEQQIRSAV